MKQSFLAVLFLTALVDGGGGGAETTTAPEGEQLGAVPENVEVTETEVTQETASNQAATQEPLAEAEA